MTESAQRSIKNEVDFISGLYGFHFCVLNRGIGAAILKVVPMATISFSTYEASFSSSIDSASHARQMCVLQE